MADEHVDRSMRRLLEKGTPAMSAGWAERTQQAIGATRPRRARRWIAAFAIAGILLLGAMGVVAGVIPLFVEGKLYFRSADIYPGWDENVTLHLLSGESETPEGFPTDDGDPSPMSDEVAWCDFTSPWPHYRGDIWKANSDGSDAVNLTELAGIGGINCMPRWSPDGSMMLFEHSDPEPGEYPCDVGWHVWLMNSDGSDARALLPDGSPATEAASWSPDGAWVLCEMRTMGTVIVSVSGTEIRPMENVGIDPAWSPDGRWIASTGKVGGTLDGESGVWRQLLLTDLEGGATEVLVGQFIVQRELEDCYPTEDQLARYPDYDHLADVLEWVGPKCPTWSPESDEIAFLAAMPFDPYGPYYRNQVEVWLYDLETDEVTQVTDDDVAQYAPRWEK